MMGRSWAVKHNHEVPECATETWHGQGAEDQTPNLYSRAATTAA
jgi:hypothetical protein